MIKEGVNMNNNSNGSSITYTVGGPRPSIVPVPNNYEANPSYEEPAPPVEPIEEYKNIDWKYFKKNFVKDERKYSSNNLSDKIKFDSYCQCDKHLEEKYVYFCEDCEINLCRKCYIEKKNMIIIQ